jgi:hypothetical protein
MPKKVGSNPARLYLVLVQPFPMNAWERFRFRTSAQTKEESFSGNSPFGEGGRPYTMLHAYTALWTEPVGARAVLW